MNHFGKRSTQSAGAHPESPVLPDLTDDAFHNLKLLVQVGHQLLLAVVKLNVLGGRLPQPTHKEPRVKKTCACT